MLYCCARDSNRRYYVTLISLTHRLNSVSQTSAMSSNGLTAREGIGFEVKDT